MSVDLNDQMSLASQPAFRPDGRIDWDVWRAEVAVRRELILLYADSPAGRPSVLSDAQAVFVAHARHSTPLWTEVATEAGCTAEEAARQVNALLAEAREWYSLRLQGIEDSIVEI